MHAINPFFSNTGNTFEYSRIVRTGSFYMTSEHMHCKYEVYFLLSGTRKFFVKDKTYYLNKGDILFINAYDIHQSMEADTPGHERIVLSFDKSFLPSANDGSHNLLLYPFTCCSNIIRLPGNEVHPVESLLLKIQDEIIEKRTGFEEMLQSILIELLIQSARFIHEGSDIREHPNPTYEKIYVITRYINSNYMKPINLSMISDYLNISPNYFSRIFKEATGFTFVEYINNVRIKEAQRLLLESRMKVIRIVEETGFGSVAHFGRTFKEISGMSPLKYRKLSVSAPTANNDS